MDNIIRQVELRDAARITEIYNYYILHCTASFETEALTEKDMETRIRTISEEFPYFVLEEGGVVQGYCYVHDWKERAAYKGVVETTVYVAREARGRGYGRKLMEQLVAACRERGYRALIACITGENTGSLAMHKRLGFTQVSHFKDVGMKFGRLLDVIDYELVL